MLKAWDEPDPPQSRRQEIRQRIGDIRTRIDELQAKRQGDASREDVSEPLASAQQHVAASQAAAQQAVAANGRAFRRAAEAHERVARHHERAAAAGLGDKDEHGRQAAIHRAGAMADTQLAEHAQSMFHDDETNDARGPDRDQTSYRFVIDAGHNEGTSPQEDAGYDEKC